MESSEIICPCGTALERKAGDTSAEIVCPSCKRVNVVSPKGASEDGHGPKGKTTTVAVPIRSRISVGTIVGPYRITGFIGEGGMGQVYTAIDQNLDRKVALKILSKELTGRENFAARFRREARAVARLNHSNIVQIYFTGSYNEQPYYAMELVEGNNLDEILQREGILEPAEAVDLIIQAARGLKAAAEEKIVHRDIKPSNMVLDGSRTLKITDFGLAKTVSTESHLTVTGAVVGTPFYMSPEQGEGRPTDHRSDIYSLGASFYHLLTGSPPFEADSPVSIILMHIRDDFPPIEERNPKVSRSLAATLERMMAKKPVDRFASYDELIDQMKKVQSGDGDGILAAAPKKNRKAEDGKSDEQPVASGSSKKPRSFVVEDDTAPSVEEIRLVRCGGIRRLLAFLIDFGSLAMLYRFEKEVMPGYWLDLIFLLITFAYFVIADGKGGLTLGKAILHCRLGRYDGSDLGLWSAALRTQLFFPILLGMGAVIEEISVSAFTSALDSVVGQSGTLLSTNGTGMAVLYRVCVFWLLVDVGVFIVIPGRRTLHDILTGSYFFARAKERKKRKKSVPAVTKKSKKVPSSTKVPRKSPAVPPPIPADAMRGRTSAQMRGAHRPRSPLYDRRGMTHGAPRVRQKIPALAAFLSLFPGLGQCYNGDVWKGIVIFFTAWLVLPWIYGIFDAYFTARRINRLSSYY